MDDIDKILSDIDDEEEVYLPGSDYQPAKTEFSTETGTEGNDGIGVEASVDAPENKETDDIIGQMDEAPIGEGESETEYAEPEESEAEEEPIPETPGMPGIEFTVKGTKSWNRREPYIFEIDLESLKADLNDLGTSFFFVTEETDKETLKESIKKEMVAYLRRPEENKTVQYSDFIYRSIIAIMHTVTESYKIDTYTKNLLIYHLGPLTLYRILRSKMVEGKYGFCYRYESGNRAKRLFPEEFIKMNVLNWYEDNINILDLPFDSIQNFENIKKIVTARYQVDLKVFNSRLNKVNKQIGPKRSLSRDKLFKLKGLQWFGVVNIEIYRRFLGRIFM